MDLIVYLISVLKKSCRVFFPYFCFRLMDPVLPSGTTKILIGTIIQPTITRDLEIIELGLICLDNTGVILRVSPATEAYSISLGLQKSTFSENCEVVVIPKGTWIIPGFVDLHYHAPQLPLAGKKMEANLFFFLFCIFLFFLFFRF